jgi:protein-disulfide isomerase
MGEDEGKSGDERTAPPYEFSGGESSGEQESESSGESGGDDERSAPAYEFSGGESSGEGDSEDDSSDDDSSDDDSGSSGDSGDSGDSRDDGPTGREADAPSYDFSGGESSGENADPSVHEDDDDEPKPAPKTAATTQWHPSRGDVKEARRQEREAKAAEDEKAERRNKRLKQLAAALGVAALIVLIAVVISSMGDEKATGGGSEVKGPAVGATAVNKRFQGIPQQGLAIGNPKAPVTLTEFADLQCPFCREATDNSLPTLIEKYVRAGKLRIEFRNWAILGPDSEKAARALEGAAAQNKAWQFLDLWYLNQGEENTGYVTDDFIRKIASGVHGLDADKVVAASNDMSGGKTVATANTEAQKFGIQSTPSYLIARTGQQPQQLQIADPNDPTLFAQAIDRIAGSGE